MKPTEANIAFAGTPEFADTVLQALLEAGIRPCVVYTQPDRPRGRGRKLTASAVKNTALEHQLAVQQPPRLTSQEAIQPLVDCQPELLIVVAYGLILPPQVLTIPHQGCVNIHASLLPRWRGAAPIARSIENGDKTTGITLMQMARGLDNGDILHQQTLPISAQETAASLQEKLAKLAAQTLLAQLPAVLSGHCQGQPQEEAGVCYAHKLDKLEAWLDWRLPATVLDQRIRAFNPFPVVRTKHKQHTIQIWKAIPLPLPAGNNNNPVGAILAVDNSGIIVRCGEGVLRLLELQRAGGKRLPVANFLNGYRLAVGDQLLTDSPDP